jgi:hypothetical protein
LNTDSKILLEKLETSLSDATGVYVDPVADEKTYLVNLADDIRRHICEPFQVSATVMPPGFPDLEVGSLISGQCVAHNNGYWLVYDQRQNRFYCFWGTEPKALGAHGVYGTPLYCWSA